MQQEDSLAKFEKEIEKNNARRTVYATYQIIEELFQYLTEQGQKVIPG